MNSYLIQLRFSAVTIAFLIFHSSIATAQKNDPPMQQYGVGVYAITSSAPSGIEGTYAMSPNMQFGSLFTFGLRSGNIGGKTQYLIAPFFRYLFTSSVSPFVQGGISISSLGGGSTSDLFLGGGVAYYLNHEIGVHAAVDLITLFFSPSGIGFGTNTVVVGADWFF